jgi:hypothetical protein
MVMLSMILSSTALTAASDHDTAEPIPIMYGPEGGSIPVGVYFADNMVYAPQWRVGNLVRIETMVLDVESCIVDDMLNMSLMPLDVNSSVSGTVDEEGNVVTYNQSDIMDDPNVLYDTYMVSISEIMIRITLTETGRCYWFENDFTEDEPVGNVTREVNKGGHLIYGLLWDTGVDDVAPGDYVVSVELPGDYDILASVAHVYPESNETTNGDPIREKPTEEVPPIGFDVLPEGTVAGCGGTSDDPNEAYVYLGALIDGTGAGTSGDNGDENGGGNDETGNSGNMYGNVNGRRR